MKCSDEELEERKKQQKEAQLRMNEKIAAWEKARLEKIAADAPQKAEKSAAKTKAAAKPASKKK